MPSHPEDDRPRQPVAEPEIIPPDRIDPARQEPPQGVWFTRQHRITIARPGPVAAVVGLLALGLLGATTLLALLGAFLLALPILGAVFVAVILAALLRGPRRL